MNPKLYKLTILVENSTRKLEIVSKDENFSQSRIERELFKKATPKKYKILKSEVIKEKLGL